MTKKIEEISSLSNGEYFLILANFKIFHEKTFQCEACLETKVVNEKGLLALRERKGCFTTDRRRSQIKSFLINTCVGNFYDPSVYFLYRLFQKYKKGIMPYGGNLVDQPAKLIDVFNIFEMLEFEKAEQEERERQQESKG